MIITRLTGGLGNQLFQYAAARRLALVRDAELKLDVTWLGSAKLRTVRDYALASFDVPQTFAAQKDIEKFTKPNIGTLSRLFLRSLRKGMQLPKSYIKEAHYHFDPSILELPDGVYLDGYWQSERYFADAANVIRAELTINKPMEGRNLELIEQINSCNAVSVHVRRGDYVSDKHTADYHGVCSLDYYHKAIQHIADAIENPVLFMFSDDPDWVRSNLSAPYPMTIVDHNGHERCVEDLRLMSACRHHILANSSFSWWGAWLNQRFGKIVVAPQRWFNNHDADTRDLCPAEWVRL